jgi:hypothetical protein
MTELNEQALDKAAQAIGNANLSNIGVPYPASACRRDAEVAIRAYLAATPIPSEVADVVGRLRGEIKSDGPSGEVTYGQVFAEAATLIESLSSRLAEVERERDEALNRVDELEAEGEAVSVEFEKDCWKRLTKAQKDILSQLDKGADLVNGDEYTPQWWIDGGSRCHPRSAVVLSRSPYVQLYRYEGGQPGVLFYRITPAGRAALTRSSEE